MIAFDPLTVPLTGTHLVEASAGTGKTHGLTALFLRLVVEAGVPVDRIALVTFTEAATQELRARLRERLATLLRRLEGARCDDAQIEALATRGEPLERAGRARAALAAYDETAITTIHGFCRRALVEHPLESAADFDDVEPDAGTALRESLVLDLWRREVVAAPEDHARWVRAQWKSPRALGDALERLLLHPDERTVPGPGPGHVATEIESLVAQGRAMGRNGDFDDWLAALRHDAISKDKRGPFSEGAPERDAEIIWHWLEHGGIPPEAIENWTPAVVERWVKKSFVGYRPEPARVGIWAAAVCALRRRMRVDFLRSRARALREALDRSRRERRVARFDDLVELLAQRLQGSEGAPLRAALRERYRVALVDEFQDTDVRQYEIFRTLFHQREGGALFLIGDPKQSIYAFRGGDVFAYRLAAEDAGEQRWTLSTNYRSDPALIAAVNSVFAERREAAAFVHDFIRFAPSAAPESAGTAASGALARPLTIWVTRAAGGRAVSRKALGPELWGAVAAQVQRLRGGPGEPPSIAVLARTHSELAEAARVLAQWRIPVRRQAPASVFATEEAAELLALLVALSRLREPARARAALATRLMGWDAAMLRRARDDEALAQAGYEQLAALERIARASGPGAMLRVLAPEAAERLLREPDGRRRLANLAQLGDLAQRAQARGGGLDGLVAWLRAALAETSVPGPELEQRPEASEAAVELLTVHKSKGLQWDYVFAPTLVGAPRPPPSDPPVRYHEADGTQWLDLGSDAIAEHWRRAVVESCAESVRVAYVALTRARHGAWTAFGEVNLADRSPLAWLLFRPDARAEFEGAQNFDAARLDAALAEWVRDSGDAIAVEPLPEPAAPQPLPASIPELAARELPRRRFRPFVMTSYSGLFGAGDDALGRDRDRVATPLSAPVDGPIPLEPRGARFGDCMHELLELAVDAGESAPDDAAVDRILRQTGHSRHAGYARALVAATLAAPLARDGTPLGQVAMRRVELEFHFPLSGLRRERLAAALALDPRYARSELELARVAPRLEGLMHGYIDLVYAHGGRAGVVDYKTNALGTRPEDYGPEALARAMRESDYDLQALIYLVALARHLRLRRPGFDPDRDLDGATYLFLRGLPHGTGIHRERPSRAVLDALDRAFGGEGFA